MCGSVATVGGATSTTLSFVSFNMVLRFTDQICNQAFVSSTLGDRTEWDTAGDTAEIYDE